MAKRMISEVTQAYEFWATHFPGALEVSHQQELHTTPSKQTFLLEFLLKTSHLQAAVFWTTQLPPTLQQQEQHWAFEAQDWVAWPPSEFLIHVSGLAPQLKVGFLEGEIDGKSEGLLDGLLDGIFEGVVEGELEGMVEGLEVCIKEDRASTEKKRQTNKQTDKNCKHLLWKNGKQKLSCVKKPEISTRDKQDWNICYCEMKY